MSNVVVRKESGSPKRFTHEWDPLRMMREMFRFDPFREMAQIWPEERTGATFVPAFEVKEAKDAFVFKADVPGIAEKDIEITLTGNRLAISGKREAEHQEKNETYFAYERSYGTFTRAFTLPEGIDAENVKAELAAGVLTVTLKKKPEAQPRHVAIKS
jgi:HSP20 family protein